MEYALVESKKAQPTPNPLSWCPLRAADGPGGAELFRSCDLYQGVATHSPSRMHTEPIFSFFFQVSGVDDWGSCTRFLVVIISQLLSSRHELPRCTKAPQCKATETGVHRAIFQLCPTRLHFTYTVREENCKRFKAKRLRVMF